MNLLHLLTETTRKYPDKAALIMGSETCSFQELLDRGKAWGAYLKSKGVVCQDPVLVLVPMSITLYEVLIGLWSIGAIPVFFDPSAGNDFIEKCCDQMRPKAMVGIRKAMLLQWFSEAIHQIPLKLSVHSVKNRHGGYLRNTFEALDDDFPGLITFTSGSTGIPKGIVRSHGFLIRQYEVLSETMHYAPKDVELGTLPVFALSNLAAGITTVIPDMDLKSVGTVNGNKLIKQIEQYSVNRITASPAFIDRIAKACLNSGKTLEGIRWIHTGGGPVFPRMMKRIGKVIPKADRIAVYGSSEAEPIAELLWDSLQEDDIKAMQSGMGLPAGTPIDKINCRILSLEEKAVSSYEERSQFDDACIKHGVGEIIVTGDHVLKGYYQGHGDLENKIRVGNYEVWHRTGDLGQFDESGRLWLLGRVQGAIHDHQGDLYPFSVECAVNAAFGIERCAVLAYQDERLLVVEEGQKIPVKLMESLAWAKLSRIITLKKLPMDKRHNAKIDYPALRKMMKNFPM